VLLLLALCGILFFYGLTAGDLYRTESLRALVAAEFLRSGNWLVPRLYDEPLLTKPPGSYAAIALASWPVGGVREWTARLPSAVAATATVLLFFWYFARQLGCQGGLVAAVLLPMSGLWLDKVPSAEIDMLHAAWVTAAIVFFLRGLEVADVKGSGGWWLGSLLCVAGGVLTKWTAPAFFYGTVIPLLWWRGRLRLLWYRAHLVSAAIAAALCLTWVGAVVILAGWDTFSYTVGREALMRLSPVHHDRPYPWAEVVFHPFRVAVATLPWSLVALFTLKRGFADVWDERGRALLAALHCWVWSNLLFWSIIPEHAPRHSFPLFPGIAGLAAFVWLGWLRGQIPWPLAPLAPRAALLGALGVWLLAKLIFVEAIIPSRNQSRESRTKGERLASQVPAGQRLYLFRPRDEWLQGVLYYYEQAHPPSAPPGPPVRRVPSPEHLPSSGELLYCILDTLDCDQWPLLEHAEVLLRLEDDHGIPITLARLSNPP
jgi:4-amino-4-deoxy-L-arabinose transferase-like glycosyltransferase